MGRRKLPPPQALPPDWPWIKRQYRIGQKSGREIARESTEKGRKISAVAIEKRAKKEGWTRDLKASIHVRVGAELATDAVSAVSRDGATDEQVIDAAAQQGAEVIRSHRRDINTRRRLSSVLLAQLDDVGQDAAGLMELIDSAKPPEGSPAKAIETFMQRRERLMKAIGLSERVGVFKDLVQADRQLIGLERQAFNLNIEDGSGDTFEDAIRRISGR